MIDLHTHSAASDGTLNPYELVQTARDIGLTALALTDHDTVDGVTEAIDAARETELVLLTGLELSAEFERGALHIVGLHIDHRDTALTKTLGWVGEVREARNVLIARKLCELDFDISIEEVAALAGGKVVGRPHFAELMLKKGYVKSHDAAFKRYLARGKPAHIPKQRLKKGRAIEIIRAAGGVPVLAHPDQVLLDDKDLNSLVKELTDLGLGGIEIYCSGYTSTHSRHYARLADKYGLVKSGGSDFHGAIKPGIKLGRGPGRLHVPDTLLDPIAERAAQIKAETARLLD
ncbi:MAG: PHP domain-containing protein [Proteobacteria bacterium]|nr:PHP domain-containing protein [Pseudomonadota bacterium]